jgi:hypothetical protein
LYSGRATVSASGSSGPPRTGGEDTPPARPSTPMATSGPPSSAASRGHEGSGRDRWYARLGVPVECS